MNISLSFAVYTEMAHLCEANGIRGQTAMLKVKYADFQ